MDKQEVIQEFLFNRGVSPFELRSEKVFQSQMPVEYTLNLIDFLNKDFVVITDLDPDGLSAANVLLSYFPDAEVYVPMGNARGLDLEFIKENCADRNILALDCGTNEIAVEEYLEENGNTLFVVDHHQAVTPVKNLINPHTTNASFVDLCASSLICVLLEDIYGPNDSAIQYAAIGTICDVVPVLFDNRYVIQKGLKLLGTLEDRPSRFVKAAGVYVQNEKDISFSLGPMLNSPRRLGEPAIAVSAYLFDDEDAIGQLKNLNKKRKLIVGELIKENRDNIIVNDGYVILEYDGEAGLAGLIAGKLCGEYNRTAIAISKHDQRGSVRTVNGTAFDIIEKSESVFGGGHENAAGFKLNTLDGFITELSEYNHTGNAEEKQVDFTSDPETAIEIYRTLQELRPFGNGFEEPVFSTTAIVENNGKTSGGYPSYLVDGYKAMAFSEKFDKDGIYDIIYRVSISNFYGKEYILLTIL